MGWRESKPAELQKGTVSVFDVIGNSQNSDNAFDAHKGSFSSEFLSFDNNMYLQMPLERSLSTHLNLISFLPRALGISTEKRRKTRLCRMSPLTKRT